MGCSPIQGVLPTVYRIRKTEKKAKAKKKDRKANKERNKCVISAASTRTMEAPRGARTEEQNQKTSTGFL
jgi:hypothetical protein